MVVYLDGLKYDPLVMSYVYPWNKTKLHLQDVMSININTPTI